MDLLSLADARCTTYAAQVKAIECDAFLPYGNDDEPRTDIAIEHPPSDTAVGRGIAVADQARLQRDGHSESEAM